MTWLTMKISFKRYQKTMVNISVGTLNKIIIKKPIEHLLLIKFRHLPLTKH